MAGKPRRTHKQQIMEATMSYQSKFRFLHPIIISSYPPTIQAHKICLIRQRNGPRMRCANSGSVPELDKKLEEEFIGMEERLSRDNCKEIGGGIVELVECLEREAIMGDDKGIEASDYHRRAHIFDKSSKVFQALKERRSSLD